MILLQPIVLVSAGSLLDLPAQRRPDRARIGAVSVHGDESGVRVVADFAERKNAFPEAMSRCSASIVSTRAPLRSCSSIESGQLDRELEDEPMRYRQRPPAEHKMTGSARHRRPSCVATNTR
jgi:hypothetical protein